MTVADNDDLVQRIVANQKKALKQRQLEEDYVLLYGRSKPMSEWGTPMKINIDANSFTNPKVTSLVMANPPAKKYRASIMVETNDLDRGSVTVQRLLSVDLAADDFNELVKAAHGHLDLVKDA